MFKSESTLEAIANRLEAIAIRLEGRASFESVLSEFADVHRRVGAQDFTTF